MDTTPVRKTSDPNLPQSQEFSAQGVNTNAVKMTSHLTSDRIGSEINVQNFSSQGRPPIPNTAQCPILFPPDVENSDIQPFPRPWQNAINDFFKVLLKENLLKKIKEKGGVAPSNEELNTQADQIIAALLKKNGGLNEEQKEIVKLATKRTLEAWKLPPTWSLGSATAADWVPTVAMDRITPPIPISPYLNEVIIGNTIDLLSNMETALIKVQSSLPPGESESRGIGSLAKIIAAAVINLREALREMQVADTSNTEEQLNAKLQQIEDRQQLAFKILQENLKGITNQMKQANVAKVMKIVAPVVSAVLFIVSTAITVTTLGMGSPMMYASVAVSSTLMGMSVAGPQFNPVTLFVQEVNKALEKAFPGEDNAWARGLVKLAAVLVLIIAITVSVAALGPVASEVSSSVIKEASKSALKQLVLQLGTSAIVSSNWMVDAILPLILEIVKKTGGDVEKAKMWTQIVVTAIVMVAMAYAMGKANKKLQPPEGAKESIGYMESFKRMWNEPSKVTAAFKNFMDDDFMMKADTILKLSKSGMDAAVGGYTAQLLFEMSKHIEKTGKMEQHVETIKALITIFEQLITSVQDSVKTKGDLVEVLDRLLNQTFAQEKSIVASMRF